MYGLRSIPTGVPSGDNSMSTRTTAYSDQRWTGATWRRKLLDEISSGPGQPLAPGHALLAACARPRVLPVDVTARIRHGIGNHGTDSVRGAPRLGWAWLRVPEHRARFIVAGIGWLLTSRRTNTVLCSAIYAIASALC